MIVGFVLALGVGLAWPFRKHAADMSPEDYTVPPAPQVEGVMTRSVESVPPAPNHIESQFTEEKQVVAKMASTADQAVGFDLEHHPVLERKDVDATLPTHRTAERTSPVTSEADLPTQPIARPAYVTTRVAPGTEAAWPEQVVHIVSNGDTLEKLAERYLGDSGRALELFDLNRDQLANPHLLPIGAELRIPVAPRTEPD